MLHLIGFNRHGGNFLKTLHLFPLLSDHSFASHIPKLTTPRDLVIDAGIASLSLPIPVPSSPPSPALHLHLHVPVGSVKKKVVFFKVSSLNLVGDLRLAEGGGVKSLARCRRMADVLDQLL
jgi:hypothetical protein